MPNVLPIYVGSFALIALNWLREFLLCGQCDVTLKLIMMEYFLYRWGECTQGGGFFVSFDLDFISFVSFERDFFSSQTLHALV